METPMTSGPVARSITFWLIAGTALAWNLLGVFMFLLRVTMSATQVARLSPEDQAMHAATPGWVLSAFGVAVVAGVAGSVGLLMRRSWAVPAFGVSLAALLLQVAGTFTVTPAWQAYGPPGLVMPAVLVLVAALLLRYARRTAA